MCKGHTTWRIQTHAKDIAVGKKTIVFPLLCVGIGVGWLLTAWGFIPGVNWVWTLGLGLLGVLLMAVVGVDKATVVAGPYLVIASIFSLLRQTDRIEPNIEIPCLVISGGLCMLIPYLLPVRKPSWYDDTKDPA